MIFPGLGGNRKTTISPHVGKNIFRLPRSVPSIPSREEGHRQTGEGNGAIEIVKAPVPKVVPVAPRESTKSP